MEHDGECDARFHGIEWLHAFNAESANSSVYSRDLISPEIQFRVQIEILKEYFGLWKRTHLEPFIIKPWNSPFESDKSPASDSDDFLSDSKLFVEDGFISSEAICALHNRIKQERIRNAGNVGLTWLCGNQLKLQTAGLDLSHSFEVCRRFVF